MARETWREGDQALLIHLYGGIGDRQYGWAGARPIQDLLIKLDSFTGDFTLWGRTVTALDSIIAALEVMEARYRIADGRGGTRVGAANNCAQDSAQALYMAV